MKEKFREIIIPQRFIYHVSLKINRSNISSQGLTPKDSSTGNWSHSKIIKYPAGIFANNTTIVSDLFYIQEAIYDKFPKHLFDIWKIDTLGLNNQWFLDSNLSNCQDYIFSPTAIPAKNLKLYRFKNGLCPCCQTLNINYAFDFYLEEINKFSNDFSDFNEWQTAVCEYNCND